MISPAGAAAPAATRNSKPLQPDHPEHAMTIPHFFSTPPPQYRTRRDFLRRVGGGFGVLALAGLLDSQGLLAGRAPAAEDAINPLAPKPSHFPEKAKSVIWLFMNGGPSHVDTWDYKPDLAKRDGQELKGFDPAT